MTDTSNPFTTLEKQIAAWNTFVSSDDKKIDHDEAMLFTHSSSQQYLRYVHKSVELEQLRYYYIARRISDLFWQHNKAHRGKETPGYPGHYGCRVRLRDRKFEMYWFYNEFTRKKKELMAITSSAIIYLVVTNIATYDQPFPLLRIGKNQS